MNIALIDDHILLTQAVKNSLTKKYGVNGIKVYKSGAEFLDDNSIFVADVVLLDLSMPDMNGFELITAYLTRYPDEAKIIILSATSDIQVVKQVIKMGVKGYLTKEASIEEIWQAINEVHAGNSYIAAALKDDLLKSVFTEEQVIYQLSPKEKEVLKKVCSGLTIKETAYELKLSSHTVQYYFRSLMKKLKLKRTPDLIVFAIKKGLYNPNFPKD